MVWLLISGRDRHAEPDALRRCSHCTHNRQRLVDGPLGARYLCRIKVSIVDIVTSEHISDENSVNIGSFEQLRKLYPMFDVVELM
jgi:hypothetical protein